MNNATQLPKFVIDTVGLVLHLEKRQLEPETKTILQDAEDKKAIIFVPAIVLAEILYLSERKRISISLKSVSDHLSQRPGFVEYPLDMTVIQAARQISDIPELHDRLIAATAKVLSAKLITNDLKIQASTFIQTVW